MKLTRNFSLNEFNSKDGAEMPADVLKNIIELASDLQKIRDVAGCAMHINSAYRSPDHNRAIGGVFNSQHLYGKASDLTSRNHTPKELYDLIEAMILCGDISEGGLGLYKSFVHYDRRGKKARWAK
tara:strand:+ start:9404 stop:9781 length:378 start_codon:yes stop_codon:yes gene_type:complete